MPKDKILTTNERMSLRPDERARYVQKLLLDALDAKRDMTASEIVEKTGLARPTITKHLELLAAKQMIRKEERELGRNKISFYKKVGNILENNQTLFEADEYTSYSFFTLGEDEGKSICIQQMEDDEYKTSSVKGTIVVKYDAIEGFIKELHTYAARMSKK